MFYKLQYTSIQVEVSMALILSLPSTSTKDIQRWCRQLCPVATPLHIGTFSCCFILLCLFDASYWYFCLFFHTGTFACFFILVLLLVDKVRFIFDPQWLRVHCPASLLIFQQGVLRPSTLVHWTQLLIFQGVLRPSVHSSCSHARVYLLIFQGLLRPGVHSHARVYLLLFQGVLRPSVHSHARMYLLIFKGVLRPRTQVHWTQLLTCQRVYLLIISSEGALYVMMTYYIDIQPLFEHTPVLNNNFEYQCHDDFLIFMLMLMLDI